MAQVLEGGRSLVLWVLASGRALRKSAGWLACWLVGWWQVGLIGWLAGRSVGGRSMAWFLGWLTRDVQQAVVQASALSRIFEACFGVVADDF